VNLTMNIEALQIGMGAGWYLNEQGRESTGLAMGLGKRACLSEKRCGMISFLGGLSEGGGKAAAVGFTFILK